MAIYRIGAAVNTAPGHYDGYRPGDRLACVTSRPGVIGPILFAIAAADPAAALDALWEIGNRVTDDIGGRCWPRDVRSLSIGDVLVLFAPGYPLQTQDVETFAVAPTGFDQVPAPDPSAWIPLEGSDATARPAGPGSSCSARCSSRWRSSGGEPGE
jgi:hypothetical protein